MSLDLKIQNWNCHQDGKEGWGKWRVLFKLHWDTRKLQEWRVTDREAWYATVHGVTKSQTWLNDWTDGLTEILAERCGILKNQIPGTSLAVWWLRSHTSTARGTGLIPSEGSKIPHAARCRYKKSNSFGKTNSVKGVTAIVYQWSRGNSINNVEWIKGQDGEMSKFVWCQR